MFDNLLSPTHLVILLVIALLIFGPRRLPELGGAVGKTIKEFQRSMQEARSQLNSATSLKVDEETPTSATVDSVRK